MGVIIIPLTLLAAWILGLAGVSAPGAPADAPWDVLVLHWTLFMPVGIIFIVSAFMHTVLARRTAASIGWQTNGFQYEIGFASLGLGVAGILAGATVPAAWLPVAAAGAIFLVLAGANHVREMAKDRNFSAGNTTILLYDFGLPISYAIALFSVGAA